MSIPHNGGSYRKKPVVIEAVRLTEHNLAEVVSWITEQGGNAAEGYILQVIIDTLEGRMYGQPGDWIIRGVQGEFHPCKPEIFDATYEPADDGMTKAKTQIIAYPAQGRIQ